MGRLALGDRGRDARRGHRPVPPCVGALRCDDQCAADRCTRPRALVAPPERQTVQHPDPRAHRDQPARGHADILREQLDGSTGTADYAKEQIDPVARATLRATIERAAQTAATKPRSAPDQPHRLDLDDESDSLRFCQTLRDRNPSINPTRWCDGGIRGAGPRSNLGSSAPFEFR